MSDPIATRGIIPIPAGAGIATTDETPAAGTTRKAAPPSRSYG
jgi:hypothetical protein